MPLYKGIYYADGSTPMSAEAISAAEATSVGDSIETLPTPVSSSSARDSKFPNPEQGDSVWRLDKMWEERYYSVYNSTSNKQGAIVAGWYPVSGKTPQLLNLGTGTQSFPAGSWTLINAAWSTNALSYEISGPTGGSITISQPGLYQIYGSFAVSGNAAKGIQFTLNSTSVDTAATFAKSINWNGESANATTIKSFIAADVIRVYGYTGTAAASINSQGYTQVFLKYLGPSN